MMWRDAKRRPVTDAVNPQLTEGDWEPGAVQRWVVPVEPDYEIEAARRTVDAAYGIGGNDD